MNREERRKMGISKETADKLGNLNQPCTVLEAVQLAQGVTEDGINNYHSNINPIIISLSIQIEVLKELLFKSNISEEEFITRFNERVDDYNIQKEEAIRQIKEQQEGKGNMPKTDVVPEDIVVETSK